MDREVLIQSAYDAAGSRAGWRDFMTRYVEAFGARGALLLLDGHNLERVSVQERIGFDHVDRSTADHYESVNPYRAPCVAMPAGKTLYSHQMVPKDVGLRSEFYTDFVVPSGLQLGALFTKLLESKGIVSGFTLHYGPRDREERILGSLPSHQALTGHIAAALRLHQRLAELEALNADVMSALEVTRLAVVVCDRDGKVLAATPEAERIVDAGDGLRYDGGRLHEAHHRCTPPLQQLIHNVAELAETRGDVVPSTVRVRRSGNCRDYEVVVLPVPIRQETLRHPGGRVLVFIHDPEVVPRADAQLLTALYGLTSREADVTRLLVRGMNSNEIGDRLQLGRETIKSHLRAAFDKTVTRSQSQLVAKVLSGLARLKPKA